MVRSHQCPQKARILEITSRNDARLKNEVRAIVPSEAEGARLVIPKLVSEGGSSCDKLRVVDLRTHQIFSSGFLQLSLLIYIQHSETD